MSSFDLIWDDLIFMYLSPNQRNGNICWLVVWTPLKNIIQLGWLLPIYGKIKNDPNHQPVWYGWKCESRAGQKHQPSHFGRPVGCSISGDQNMKMVGTWFLGGSELWAMAISQNDHFSRKRLCSAIKVWGIRFSQTNGYFAPIVGRYSNTSELFAAMRLQWQNHGSTNDWNW